MQTLRDYGAVRAHIGPPKLETRGISARRACKRAPAENELQNEPSTRLLFIFSPSRVPGAGLGERSRQPACVQPCARESRVAARPPRGLRGTRSRDASDDAGAALGPAGQLLSYRVLRSEVNNFEK